MSGLVPGGALPFRLALEALAQEVAALQPWGPAARSPSQGPLDTGQNELLS